MRVSILLAGLAVTAAPAFAEDLAFTLVNSSSANLVEMYVTPHDADQWGDNILTVDAVKAGEQGKISIADGEAVCDYDMRFVMDTGVTVDGTQDLCKLSTFTLHD